MPSGRSSGTCSLCGRRIIGTPHKLGGKTYCGECYLQAAQANQQADKEKSDLYEYLFKLFGTKDIPFSLQSAIDRTVEEGVSIKGIKFTLYYYYEVLGNDPNDINKASWVIRDMYEEARSYVEDMRKLGEENQKVPIHEPITIEVKRPVSTRKIIKRWRMED